MRFEISLSQKLSLQLKLAPQIIQSIEILQLPALRLQELIEAALDENEALERVTDAEPEASAETAESNGAELEKGAEMIKEADELAETLERLETIEQAADRDYHEFGARRIVRSDEDPKTEAIYNTAAPSVSLHDSLYEQFLESESDEALRVLGRHIIYNLDENGLLRDYPLEQMLENPELRGAYTMEQAEEALRIVQSLEPKGVGGRNIRESLLLQLDPEDLQFELKRKLIGDHLLDINKNKRPKVARELNISIAELNDLVASISVLDPHPGVRVSTGRNPHIHPDVVVELIDGRWEIRLEDAFFPRVRLNPHYREMLQQSSDPKVREYVRKKIENAKWLVDAIQQRQNTLYRVVEEIFKVQSEYLDFGKSHLKPLKMQEIADRVGIHVSTVSRAIADKWVQTPRGIVPLKFFFTGGAETADGETISRRSVKQKVREIIEGEDKHSPMSDEQVAEELKQQGLDIARRTVTKYRKALLIPSSRQRRQWD